jgi:hypothetical protein
MINPVMVLGGRKSSRKFIIITVLFLLLAAIVVEYLLTENLWSSANKNKIMVHVYVLNKDNPEPRYEIKEGIPKNVGVYEFYYKNPELPGTGAFKKLDSIPLNRINETAFYGEKSITRINGTLCIGYPSTNFIDGKACVRVDQSQNETNITVHYWETNIAII